MPTIDELATFCKKKGFVYPSAEIYNSLAGFFDLGPLGVELSTNIKAHWWHHFVRSREDVVGIDGSIITHPKVWRASGHLDSFEDIFVEDVKTKERYRADHLVEDALKIPTDGMSVEQLWQIIQKHELKSPKGNPLSQPNKFNLMFHTNIGSIRDEKSTAYLRPETAQNIFINFKAVQETSRLKLPFGIAQIGKGFRNEISPRDFLFRVREFEMMELEYFFDHATASKLKPKNLKLTFLSQEEQHKKSPKTEATTIVQLLASKKLAVTHAYWLAEAYQWFLKLGLKKENLRIREHTKEELSHYSTATFDIEYLFPFGWKELQGCANRGMYDLTQHEKHSNTKLSVFDEDTKQKILPSVIEPAWGVGRTFLALLLDAYNDDKKRGNIVLKLNPKLAPIQVGVFPLVKNKKQIVKKAREIFNALKQNFTTTYDESGSIGRRYARADELGIPFCITVDFDSLKDKKVTIRNRDTTKQIHVKASELKDIISKIMTGTPFEKCGKLMN